MGHIEALVEMAREWKPLKKQVPITPDRVPFTQPVEQPQPDKGLEREKMWDIRRHMPRPEKPQKRKTPQNGK